MSLTLHAPYVPWKRDVKHDFEESSRLRMRQKEGSKDAERSAAALPPRQSLFSVPPSNASASWFCLKPPEAPNKTLLVHQPSSAAIQLSKSNLNTAYLYQAGVAWR
ncbi:hypothetical protein PM082_016505 [Marasmius tenuissimus]|nr:hypothetical protein PM082_016505 [Marasmius tenuissimus]